MWRGMQVRWSRVTAGLDTGAGTTTTARTPRGCETFLVFRHEIYTEGGTFRAAVLVWRMGVCS